MKKWFLFLLVIAKCCAFSQNVSYADVVHYYDTSKNFNGVVLVSEEGKVQYLGKAGVANRKPKQPFDNNSVFKIASITKTFTAVMVLQLMEEGKVNLDSPIKAYLPTYKGVGADKITVRHLLTYSSGLPDCESYEGTSIYTKPITEDVFIAKYCSGKPEYEPGKHFRYNNGDYVLLGKIIEHLTGSPFLVNLQRRILQKLQMRSTGLASSKTPLKKMVTSYWYDNATQRFTTDSAYLIQNYFSAGAMYSTAEDLLKFDNGIFSFILLKPETVKLMIEPNPLLDNVGLGFWYAGGYGLLNSPFVYRPGGIYGSTANWIHVLGANRAIILLSNTNATNLFEMSQQLNGVATKQLKSLPK